jgi:hypothetical protein
MPVRNPWENGSVPGTHSSIAFCLLAAAAFAESRPPHSLNPAVEKIVAEVSEDRIAATLTKLESFPTRNTMSEGARAASEWIFAEFKSYSPRLQVAFDSYPVKKGGRVTRDIELVNVVARLPGTATPERELVISGHYDSLNVQVPDWVNHQEETRAPGVDDDGSGVAAVLELARVLSQREFKRTIVFIAFAGEEQGLIGSRLYAERARRENRTIDAVLNNDIIGTGVAGDGRSDTHTVRVFSEGPDDSPSRQVARYAKQIGERYIPSMKVALVFRPDRFGRGGDHTPFNRAGYAAVRFTTANENYAHQHSPLDAFENVSTPYLTRVAKINAATLASLALAPAAPVTTGDKPLLDRGPSGYDAHLRWLDPHPEPNLAGYVVLMRATTAPYWEMEVFAGKRTEYLIPNVSIDDVVLGVKAVDNDGNESLAAAYVVVPYAR